MRRRVVGALLVTVWLSAGCDRDRVRRSRSAVVAQSVGCYRLEPVGEWEKDAFAPIRERMATFHLSADPVSAQRPELRRVDGLPAMSFDSSRARLWLWSVDSTADVVRVSVGDAFGGIALALSPDTVSTGRPALVIGFGDLGPTFERVLGRALAIPIACADTGPAPAAVIVWRQHRWPE